MAGLTLAFLVVLVILAGVQSAFLWDLLQTCRQMQAKASTYESAMTSLVTAVAEMGKQTETIQTHVAHPRWPTARGPVK